MTIDERIEALTMNLELLSQQNEAQDRRINNTLNAIVAAIEQDAQNIRALANIADAHERRLSRLEGQ